MPMTWFYLPHQLLHYRNYWMHALITEVAMILNLKVKKGSIIGVIGGSGAGKSTGIRVMTAQLAPSKGICKTVGYNVKTDPAEVVHFSSLLLKWLGLRQS